MFGTFPLWLIPLTTHQAWAAPQATSVVLGDSFSCALTSGKQVVCDGDTAGLGVEAGEAIEGLPPVERLFAGPEHLCAVDADRRAWCLGANGTGQLGHQAQGPAQVPLPLGVLDMDLGPTHTCAVLVDQSVACWGDDLHGQSSGRPSSEPAAPAPLPGLSGVFAVATGARHTCAIRQGDEVWCWGRGAEGQLGRLLPGGMGEGPPAPTGLTFDQPRHIDAHDGATCVLQGEEVVCFGPDGAADDPLQGRTRALPTSGVRLAMSGTHACAADLGGRLACWGSGDPELLGVRRGAMAVEPLGHRAVRSFALRERQTCVTTGEGAPSCWGRYTAAEWDASHQEHQAAPKPPRQKSKRQLPPHTQLVLRFDEVLQAGGAHPRVTVQTTNNHPCANTTLEQEVTESRKGLTMRLGDPVVADARCIPSPAPATATLVFPPDTEGRRDLVVAWNGQEDIYQLWIGPQKLEVIPLQDTFSFWEGDANLQRIPEGALAVTCVDHTDSPVCLRRARQGMPTCDAFWSDPLIDGAPLVRLRKPANTWFTSLPGGRLISPDTSLAPYERLVRQTLRDGSGCTEVAVRTFDGQTWTNRP